MSLGIAVGHVLKFWRIPDRVIDRINPLCLPFTIAAPAVLGSAMSVWIIGTMALCLVRTVSGAMALTKRPQARIISLVFALWFVLHAVFGLTHWQTNETLRQIGETLPFIGMLPLYAGLALTWPERLVKPTGLAVIAGAFAALGVSMFDMLRGLPRAEGLVGNPGPFGVMCLLLYGYCLVTAVNSGGRMRLLAGLAAAAALVCVVLTGMRSLWPGLLLLPVIVGIIFNARIRRDLNWRHMAVAGGMLAAAVVVTIPVIEQRVGVLITEMETLGTHLDMTRSLDQHVALWTAGLELIRAEPLLGHGLETPPLMLAETQRLFGEGFALSHFHNELIDIGVKAGVAGMALLIAMVVLPLVYTAAKRTTPAGRYGFAMMCVLMACYGLAGTSALMLGHDIMDTVFIFSVAYWGMFAFEADAGTGNG